MNAIAAIPLTPLPSGQAVTPDGLLKLGQQGLYELVDGEPVEKRMSFLSGKVTSRVDNRLSTFVEHHGLGSVAVEVSFRCFPDKPLQVRRPDIAFVSTARLHLVPLEGHVPVPPDLAIEILSPGDEAIDLDRKLADYQSAVIPLVWVLNPDSRTVRIYRPDGSSRQLTAADRLDGEAVVPGFSVAVDELFPPVPVLPVA
jgi:Uma2 family endonuclease